MKKMKSKETHLWENHMLCSSEKMDEKFEEKKGEMKI
jgi:hypothetical protein